MFTTLLILLGLAAGFALFVYIASGVDQVRRAVDPPPNPRPGKDRLDPRAVFQGEWKQKEVPRPRICPLCGTYLSREDYLFSQMGPEPPPGSARKRQVHIYGCPYCFGSRAGQDFQQTNL